MPKSTDRTAEPRGESPSDRPNRKDDLAAYNGEFFSAYTEANKAFFENAVAWNQEMMRFANERLEANARLFQSLPTCRDWQEAASLQSEFARSETDAYRTALPKLTEQAVRNCAAVWDSTFGQAPEVARGPTKTAPKT